MIALQVHADGTLLPVRAQAGARRNGVRGEQAGRLQVSVTQAPEKGKANQAIIAVLAGALELRKSQIELQSGETSREKQFLIRDVTIDELARRIEQALSRGKRG